MRAGSVSLSSNADSAVLPSLPAPDSSLWLATVKPPRRYNNIQHVQHHWIEHESIYLPGLRTLCGKLANRHPEDLTPNPALPRCKSCEARERRSC